MSLSTVALTTVLVPGPAVHADLNYRAEIRRRKTAISPICWGDIRAEDVEDKPPASEEALRRRADRDLGRLADAALQPRLLGRGILL